MTTLFKAYPHGVVTALVLVTFSLFQPGHAANVTVSIANFAFEPAEVTINVGDTVTWVQQDSTQHNSVSDTGVWSGRLLSRGQSFAHTFNAAGTFPYHCTPHPFMQGTVIVQAAANTPPNVAITSPASGATFTAPAAVTIQATATDNGTITQVEFFDSATSLGVDTTSPFSISATLSAGSHSLTAKATDNAGASTTSSVVNITVNAANNPPSINLVSPLNNATFTAPANITLEAAAADTDGTVSQVEFFSGSTSLGVDLVAPFSITLTNVLAGNQSFTAKATDNLGATTTSSPISVIVNAASSRATLSAPSRLANGQFQFTINGTTGQTYAIQASSNLTDWSALRTMQAPSDSFTFVDTEAASLGHRFYRVLQK